MGLSHRMSVVILYVISGALGLLSIALVDKGLLPSLILLIIIIIFVIGGARNLTEVEFTESQATLQKKAAEGEVIETAKMEAASGESNKKDSKE